ncbi:MAG: hypothetical protein IIA91_06695 [Chloroflexi bacterium]|nr:hypothetical protein [Chloroflexota bacterium]
MPTSQQRDWPAFRSYVCYGFKLFALLIWFVPLLALGTAYWSETKLFAHVLPTASYPSSLVAFAVAILGGHLAGFLISASLRLWVIEGRNPEGPGPEPVTPALVGAIERAFYVYALYVGFPEAIAVWMALKAVGRWQTKERAQFNAFLIGSAVSLAFGVLGAAIVAKDPL